MIQDTTLRVLVVDDCRRWREAIRRLLSARGFEVVEAEDGMDGVRAVRQRRPHVILMDLEMPRMDGWEVLAALREDPEIASIPVLITSSAEPCPVRLHSFRSACSIGKAARPEYLVASILSCIAR